jgi:hypothetical protein
LDRALHTNCEDLGHKVSDRLDPAHVAGGPMHAEPELAPRAGLRRGEVTQPGRGAAEVARQARDADPSCGEARHRDVAARSCGYARRADQPGQPRDVDDDLISDQADAAEILFVLDADPGGIPQGASPDMGEAPSPSPSCQITEQTRNHTGEFVCIAVRSVNQGQFLATNIERAFDSPLVHGTGICESSSMFPLRANGFETRALIHASHPSRNSAVGPILFGRTDFGGHTASLSASVLP